MEVIRANYEADDSMYYCPSWSTPNKARRPSKGKRKLSALEKSQGKKKKPKPLTRSAKSVGDSVIEQSIVGIGRNG